MATIHDSPPFPLFPPTGTEKSVRDRVRERGKEEDDVPNAASVLLPPHPSCDGQSTVLRSPREEGVWPKPPSQRCHGNRVIRPTGAQALHHPVSGASPLQHIQDCVLGGVPAGEQSGTSFVFLLRVLPGLAEVSLSQLQPSCVWTSLWEWRYLLETQPVCVSARLDRKSMSNRCR